MADKSYVYVLGRLDAMNRTVHRHSSMAGLWQDADRLQVPSCERYVPTKMRQVRLGFSVADGTHVGSNWSRVTTKLRDWRPLLLATSFTAAWGSSGGLIHTFRGGMGTLGIPRMNRSGSRA